MRTNLIENKSTAVATFLFASLLLGLTVTGVAFAGVGTITLTSVGSGPDYSGSGSWTPTANCWTNGNDFAFYIKVFEDLDNDQAYDYGADTVLQTVTPAACGGDFTSPVSNADKDSGGSWPASGQSPSPSTFPLSGGLHNICAVLVHANDNGNDQDVADCLNEPVVVPPTTGNIVVVKQVTGDGADSSQSFDFDTIGTGFSSFSLSADDGSHDSGDLDPDSYSVSEINVPDNWNSDGGVCESTDGDDSSTPDSIDLSAGETITCTFTNTFTPPTSTVTICKYEDEVTDDNLLSGWDVFIEDEDANTYEDTTDDSGCITLFDIPFGSYILGEILEGGWFNVSGNDSAVEVDDPEETFPIVNSLTPPTTGTLTLVKVVEGDADPTEWILHADGATSISGASGDDEITGATINAGSYDLSESDGPEDYTESGWVCVGAAEQTDSDTVVVGENEDITCTITNTYQEPGSATGSIQITKYLCPFGTGVNRDDNGVGGSVPGGCELQTGATFGYVHGDQTDANAPYPELSADITEAGETTDGVLEVSGVPADGRYLIVETDGDGNQLPAEDVLGLYCEGDGDTDPYNNDNQELTFVPEDGTASCVAYNEAPEGETLYTIDGYVWNDENENDTWDRSECDGQCDEESEDPLEGWTISVTNGEDTFETTSNPDGYYSFLVPAGTWTVTETVQSEWEQTFPNEGTYEVTVPTVEITLNFPFNLFIGTAHAQTITSYDFGNVFVGSTSSGGGSGGGGGGGGSSEPEPEILGEQTEILPAGAPNTGFGGVSTGPLTSVLSSISALLGLLGLGFATKGEELEE